MTDSYIRHKSKVILFKSETDSLPGTLSVNVPPAVLTSLPHPPTNCLTSDKLLPFASPTSTNAWHQFLPCSWASGSQPRSLCVWSGAVWSREQTAERREGGQIIKCMAAQALCCRYSVTDGGSRPRPTPDSIPAPALTHTLRGEARDRKIEILQIKSEIALKSHLTQN